MWFTLISEFIWALQMNYFLLEFVLQNKSCSKWFCRPIHTRCGTSRLHRANNSLLGAFRGCHCPHGGLSGGCPHNIESSRVNREETFVWHTNTASEQRTPVMTRGSVNEYTRFAVQQLILWLHDILARHYMYIHVLLISVGVIFKMIVWVGGVVRITNMKF